MSFHASTRRTLLLIGAFAMIYIGWGTTYLANHFLLRELPPFVIATLRFLFAGTLALGWVLASGKAQVQRSDFGGALVGGVLLIAVGQGALIYANQFLPTGMLAMLYTTLPLWSVALEWLLDRRPPLWVLCGLALASGGIVMLMGKGLGADSGFDQWFASALVVIATLLWGGRRVDAAPAPALPFQLDGAEPADADGHADSRDLRFVAWGLERSGPVQRERGCLAMDGLSGGAGQPGSLSRLFLAAEGSETEPGFDLRLRQSGSGTPARFRDPRRTTRSRRTACLPGDSGRRCDDHLR